MPRGKSGGEKREYLKYKRIKYIPIKLEAVASESEMFRDGYIV